MKITNKSGKIIAIGELSLLPGDTQNLPKDFEGNPVIQFFANTGKVELIEEVEAQAPAAPPAPPVPPVTPPADPKTTPPSGAESEVEKVIAGIKEMKRAELDALAAELGIEVVAEDTVPTLKEKLIAFYQQQ